MPKKPPTAKPKSVTITIDASLKKLWEEARKRLTQATSQGALAWDERYEAIADITEHQPPLYLAGGFATEGDFFKKAIGEDRSTVYRNMRVAKYATAREVETYGASRLDAAITFVETKNGGALKGRTPIDFASLRFPVKDGTKKLADATVEELRDAVATLKGRQRAAEKASPEATAISALLKKNKVKGVTFDVRKDLVVLRVPLTTLATTGRALAAFKT
jgi:hypothetical protein